jgi:hypothetical protein
MVCAGAPCAGVNAKVSRRAGAAERAKSTEVVVFFMAIELELKGCARVNIIRVFLWIITIGLSWRGTRIVQPYVRLGLS